MFSNSDNTILIAKSYRNCIILTRYLISISGGEFSLKQILVDAVILPQVGLIGSPVHLVSLRDKHWRPILDTTPLIMANIRVFGFQTVCLPATLNNCIVVLYHATKISQLL